MPPAVRAIALPTALAAALAAVYLIWAPTSQDLAAASFRAELFSEHGFAIWNNEWYSGHALLSYSVLYPPLGALLGARLVAALAVVAAAALFAWFANRHFGARALWPSLWFAAGIASWLLTGRVPFLLSVPFGLGAVFLAAEGRVAAGAGLAALASLASPVSGLFVGLAGVALALAGGWSRGLWLALGAGVPMLALNFAFPVGGAEPFVFSAFIALPLLAIVSLWLVPAQYRALRIGVVLYVLLALAVFIVPSPLGGNVTRLGALLAGPVLMLVLWPRGRLVVAAVALPLLYWQLVAPVRDVRKAAGDPSTERAFYTPLLAELDRVTAAEGPVRVQIPPTKNRWEAAYVAPEYPLARGWLRQLEDDDFDLFKDGRLTPEAYRKWLAEHGVSYVAVPAAKRDVLAEDEVELIAGGLGFLEPLWRSEDWDLYRVRGGALAEDARVTELGTSEFAFTAPPGEYLIRVRWTPYWEVEGEGVCLAREGDWMVAEVEPGAPGEASAEARFSLAGLAGRDRVCG